MPNHRRRAIAIKLRVIRKRYVDPMTYRYAYLVLDERGLRLEP